MIASREIGEARSIINKIVVDAHHRAADAFYWHVVGRTSTGSAGMKSESFVAPDILKRRCFARTYRNFVKIVMRPEGTVSSTDGTVTGGQSVKRL